MSKSRIRLLFFCGFLQNCKTLQQLIGNLIHGEESLMEFTRSRHDREGAMAQSSSCRIDLCTNRVRLQIAHFAVANRKPSTRRRLDTFLRDQGQMRMFNVRRQVQNHSSHVALITVNACNVFPAETSVLNIRVQSQALLSRRHSHRSPRLLSHCLTRVLLRRRLSKSCSSHGKFGSQKQFLSNLTIFCRCHYFRGNQTWKICFWCVTTVLLFDYGLYIYGESNIMEMIQKIEVFVGQSPYDLTSSELDNELEMCFGHLSNSALEASKRDQRTGLTTLTSCRARDAVTFESCTL